MIRQIGVSEVTYYRWRQEFGGLKIEQVKRTSSRAVALFCHMTCWGVIAMQVDLCNVAHMVTRLRATYL